MKFQVAKVYRYGRFMGYGIAVDGNLLDGQVSTTVDTDANGIPLITAVFNMNNEHAENQITILLDDEGDSQKVDLIKKAVAEAAARNYRTVVNSVSRGE
ncbi:TPA: hypothetical protein MM032_003085 [Klebsiella variicola subsp. variicola]|nr:hypothetical protein [Klebsiella variicola]HBZ7505107.1 hypothetical protein [Klebsiella variicola subsp. variicola]HBZ7547564.1 hypothetical protein [Klebsiella variicola subsp. variicola]HBZ7787785.1 hypothetical protein [Klebsiella variicola subsp. variicola]